MRVVARNQRTRFGEIDLVCRDGDGYVFVEVKTRSAGSFVAAAEAVDRRKLGRLPRLGAGWPAMPGARDARWPGAAAPPAPPARRTAAASAPGFPETGPSR